jgi:hypothetical protein
MGVLKIYINQFIIIIIIIMFQFCGFESLVILFLKCILSKFYVNLH